ncbi:MAG: hypothetical protein INR69_24040 [Mucilaginibacter polytrichastri]|nr:hypothetical protein [Mucilaginibacter polytrichastri]
MKTSLAETRQIDRVATGKASGQERALHEAGLILHADYADNFLWQKKVYPQIKKYGQKKLREELDEIRDELFSGPEHQTFRQKILRLFGKA